MPIFRTSHMMQARAFTTLALCSLGFSACTSTPAAVVDVKVGIVTYITFSPFFIAKEEGYFAEQNLNVELELAENSTVIMPSLEQGQLDAAGDAPVAGLFNAINQTGNIKIVADRGYLDPDACDYIGLLASPDWVKNNPNPTADSFRGMRFAIDINTFQAFMLEKVLATVGLTLEDVETQYIPPPNLIEAAKNGSVDFISTAEPWVTRVADTKAMALWKGYQNFIPNMQSGFLNYGKKFSQEDPDLGQRFMVAYLKGVRQFNQGKTERNLEIIAKYTKLPTDLLQRICWPAIRNDGAVDMTTIMEYQEFAVRMGQLDEVAPEEAIWESRFVNFANKQLG
jgi:NitT/TauT family transport system substrate-binding protein